VLRSELRKILVGALVLLALGALSLSLEAWWQANPLGAAIIGAY